MANSKALVILAAVRRRLGQDIPIRDPYGILNVVSMDILSRLDYLPLWTVAILRTVAPYDDGTASVNITSKTVAGVGTTWTDAMVGRKFKFDNDTAYYRIASRTNDTELKLEEAYAGDENASGEDYVIFQDEYSLASDFDGLVTYIKDLKNDKILDQRSILYGDAVYDMSVTAGSPDFAVMIRQDSSGYYQVRLQPSPNAVEIYEYRYRKKRTLLNEWGDLIDLPPEKEEVLIAGMLVKIAPSQTRHADYENYFRRFKADAKKDEGVRRYIRGGMRGDGQVLIASTRYDSDLIRPV